MLGTYICTKWTVKELKKNFERELMGKIWSGERDWPHATEKHTTHNV